VPQEEHRGEPYVATRRPPVKVTPGQGPAEPVRQRAGPGQGIVLRTGFFVLDWTLKFTSTTVTLDGHPFRLPWGEHFIPLETGCHQLQVSFPHFPLSRAGKASVEFDVGARQVVRASYRAPRSVLVAFMPGQLTVAAGVD
jgi:hypothetical protein